MIDPISSAKAGIELLSDVMKVAGDNPQVKEAGCNLGKTALTITKTINNVLLPLAAINFAFDKARVYFDEKFADDLATRTATIPTEDIVEPRASIAGPTLQGLAFTHEEVALKDMYLGLLSTAMDRRVASNAHPAFVEVIKQISADEAPSLQQLLNFATPIPIVEIRLNKAGEEGWETLLQHVMNHKVSGVGSPIEIPRLAAMVDNWLRLGLVDVSYEKQLMDEKAYLWVVDRPEYIRYRSQHEQEGTKVTFSRGIVKRTAFGLQFANAAGLIS